MMKFRKIAAGLLLCTALFGSLQVSAAGDYVYDDADLLTTEEEAALQEYAEDFKANWDMNFLVVTTEDAEGKTSEDYANDFYDARFPEDSEEDGMIYIIDMDNREINLTTCGLAIRYLTDDRINSILDDAYEYVAEGDYYGTFVAYFDSTEYYLNQGIPKDQYNYDTETGKVEYYDEPARITSVEFLIALIAGLAAAVGTVAFVTAKYQLKFEDFHYNAHTASEVKLSVKQDRLVNKFVTHRRIPRNNGSSGGGGKSGGSRSSVSRSSSGRSHGGGGGRKF